MHNEISIFENIVRKAYKYTDETDGHNQIHPFEERNIHELVKNISINLFDNGHYAQASFETWKLIDKIVKQISGSSETGFKLMMSVLSETNPIIKINDLKTESNKDEQKGFQFLFAGGVMAIRNPRGHEINVKDDPDTCLDHLSFASYLIRKLLDAGYNINSF